MTLVTSAAGPSGGSPGLDKSVQPSVRKALQVRRAFVVRRRELISDLSVREEKEEATRRTEANRREKDEAATRVVEEMRRKQEGMLRRN